MIRPATIAEVRQSRELVAAATAATGVGGVDGCDVQWQHLEHLEQAGALLVLGVEVDGKLAGEAIAAVMPALFRPVNVCTTLSLFVQPRHRWRWGWRLLLELLRAADARGAARVDLQVLLGSRLQFLAQRLELEPTALVFEVAPRDFLMQYSARHGAGDRGIGVARLRRGGG